MTRPRSTVVVAVCGVAAAASILYARETTRPVDVPADRLLYLQSGETADRAFLAFDALAADIYWIRAIQHYGRDRRSVRTTGRFELLQPLLEITTSLDPHFNIAYRFGAILLALEPPNGPGRTDQAIALLQKGLASNPARWQYAHDIGFIHYWHTGDHSQAARWFERAAAMPEAPEWIAPVAAATLVQGGDRQGARRILAELRGSRERYIREAAERSLAQLEALDVIDSLQARVEEFHALEGHYPDGWPDVIRRGLLPGVPVDPTLEPFVYDTTSNVVRLSPSSSLAPLPHALGAR